MAADQHRCIKFVFGMGGTFMDSYGLGILGILAMLFILGMFAAIVALFISLGKQGDERRQLIVGKASTGAFFWAVCYILGNIIEDLYRSIAHGLPSDGMNPFIALFIVAVIYLLHLLYYRRKFGD